MIAYPPKKKRSIRKKQHMKNSFEIPISQPLRKTRAKENNSTGKAPQLWAPHDKFEGMFRVTFEIHTSANTCNHSEILHSCNLPILILIFGVTFHVKWKPHTCTVTWSILGYACIIWCIEFTCMHLHINFSWCLAALQPLHTILVHEAMKKATVAALDGGWWETPAHWFLTISDKTRVSRSEHSICQRA